MSTMMIYGISAVILVAGWIATFFAIFSNKNFPQRATIAALLFIGSLFVSIMADLSHPDSLIISWFNR